MYKQDTIRALFPDRLLHYFKKVICDYEEIRELRIRRNGPMVVIKGYKSVYLTREGNYTDAYVQGVCLSDCEFTEFFSHICKHSVYAFEDELRRGYLTVEGGHRIGVVGQTVCDGSEVKSIKYFTALNIRIAHEIKGSADGVVPYLYEENILNSTLIVSPPGCGKTTLLRDLVRKISNGCKGHLPLNVSLIDERSEIASCYLGVAQNDVGMHTDILDACPKSTGMLMVLRSMAPEVIAVDELGDAKDYQAVRQAFYLGCKVLATIHGSGYENILMNANLSELISVNGFQRLIFLGGREHPGKIIRICNERGEDILRK